MTRPSRRRERTLRRRGFHVIAGADEAGRGALAGPLVAAAVILPAGVPPLGIRDSKLLTAPERERQFVRITRLARAWAIAIAAPEQIDRNGIHPTNLAVLREAVAKLSPTPDYVLVDAWPLRLPMPSEGIIRGDQSVLAIAAASIVAKVVRDHLMAALHPLYPVYDFARHKGYGTLAHRQRLAQHGPSPLHRRTFNVTLPATV
ncbi:MAG: ribonuclease HII [Candidatus Kerfeldbacteria bacterium]|nr:ribonuclease HII [Candidatus Kerfeldbacteria bacterium]